MHKFLGLLLLGLFWATGRAETPPWTWVTQGFAYREWAGGVAFLIQPPRLTPEGLRQVEAVCQEVRARAASGLTAWMEACDFAREHGGLWQDTGLVLRAWEGVVAKFFGQGIVDRHRERVRNYLLEALEALRQGEGGPPENPWSRLPPELRGPEGGLRVGPDTFPLLLETFGPRGLFPTCRLAASAMPLASRPGAKAYATAHCSDEALIWGLVETGTYAYTLGGGKGDFYRGWPFSQSMSLAQGKGPCRSKAWAASTYRWEGPRLYAEQRLAYSWRCLP